MYIKSIDIIKVTNLEILKRILYIVMLIFPKCTFTYNM